MDKIEDEVDPDLSCTTENNVDGENVEKVPPLSPPGIKSNLIEFMFVVQAFLKHSAVFRSPNLIGDEKNSGIIAMCDIVDKIKRNATGTFTYILNVTCFMHGVQAIR